MNTKKPAATIVISVPFVDTLSDFRERVESFRLDLTPVLHFVSGVQAAMGRVSPLGRGVMASVGSPRRVGNTIQRWLPAGIIALVVVGAILGAKAIIDRSQAAKKSPGDSRVTLEGARAQANLGKEFSFGIKDNQGKEVTKLKYRLESVELRDEIIVKGQKYVAVKGRTFFILTVKLRNDSDKTINFNARDYVRLTANGDEKERLAADIHNDPVEVQPISTKETRLGWPVDDTDKNFVLFAGEIDGEKQRVPIKF